jgi:acetylglutamate kinase
MTDFVGKTFVIRVDGDWASGSTLVDDLQVLADAHVRPIVIAPDADGARALVRTINRSGNLAVGLSGSDAAMLPGRANGIGNVQIGILTTLTDAGYVPVIAPTAFAVFASDDLDILADDVARAVAAATFAARAIFFNRAGGVEDPATHRLLDELTPSEALVLADDDRVPNDLRAAMRAAALSVRDGIPAANIVDGHVPHATVVELLTAQHVGTRVTGGIYLAA